MTRPAFALLLSCALGLAACAPGRDLPLLANAPPGAYRLGGGGRIRVIVLGADQLSGEYQLDDQGWVAIPLVGAVDGAGLTVPAFEQRLAAELKRGKVLTHPSVSVQVTAYRPIFVLGEVAKPGEYPCRPDMTMLTAVAVAGGFTYRGVQDYAGLVRSDEGRVVEGKVEPRSLILPGDVVRVYERRF